METSQLLISTCNAIKSLFKWVLKLTGRKIVEIDHYDIKTIEVSADYFKNDPEYNHEEKKGARFFWSKEVHPGYEQYYQIQGNQKLYFERRGAKLWIKRSSKHTS